MENNLRDEFEEYVKKLSAAICKDILLEKMEELFEKYEIEYSKLEISTQCIVDAGNELGEETRQADKTIKEINKTTKNMLKSISSDIAVMESNNKKLFDEMRNLNDDNKKQFIEDLSKSIEYYKDDLLLIFEQENAQISHRLGDVIKIKDLKEFSEVIENNTKKSHELVSFINNTYEREIEKSIQNIINNTKNSQDKINNEISDYVKKVLKDLGSATSFTENKISRYGQSYAELFEKKMALFQNEFKKMKEEEKCQRETYLEKQVELVKQIGPSDEKIQQLTDQVIKLEQFVFNMNKRNSENQKLFQDNILNRLNQQAELERKKADNKHLIEQKMDNISWRIYMTFSNTMIICLFAIMVILLKPWEIWGIKYTIIITAIFISIVLLVSCLRKCIARAIAKSQVNKYAQKFME